MAASEELYAAGQQAQGGDGAQNSGGNAAGADDVQDADFEEVK
jgi:molecular chaperone DnaK